LAKGSTVHNVASAAGVSVATASKALAGRHVSAENKEKVLRVAARLGYVVNDAARALRSSRSNTVGLILNELNSLRGIGLLDAMSASLEAAGYSLLCATARADTAAYDILAGRFLERRVDGLFCVMPPAHVPSVLRYAAAGVPIVIVTEQGPILQSQCVVRPSIEAAAGQALGTLIELGHRRMLSLGDGSNNLSLEKIDPNWQRQIAIELMQLQDIGSLDRLVQDILRREDRPTLICAYEAQAEALFAVCRALCVRVPDDLSIVAFTRAADEQRAIRLDLSSVYLRSELLGAEAATQMIALLDNKPGAKKVSVEVGAWTLRGSVGRAPLPA
jgi:DNA-binding LacI/PurR family transcriptional regulator